MVLYILCNGVSSGACAWNVSDGMVNKHNRVYTNTTHSSQKNRRREREKTKDFHPLNACIKKNWCRLCVCILCLPRILLRFFELIRSNISKCEMYIYVTIYRQSLRIHISRRFTILSWQMFRLCRRQHSQSIRLLFSLSAFNPIPTFKSYFYNWMSFLFITTEIFSIYFFFIFYSAFFPPNLFLYVCIVNASVCFSDEIFIHIYEHKRNCGKCSEWTVVRVYVYRTECV